MRKSVGKYEYVLDSDEILVWYYNEIEKTTTRIAYITKNGSTINININENNPDFMEIYSNALRIFKGEI